MLRFIVAILICFFAATLWAKEIYLIPMDHVHVENGVYVQGKQDHIALQLANEGEFALLKEGLLPNQDFIYRWNIADQRVYRSPLSENIFGMEPDIPHALTGLKIIVPLLYAANFDPAEEEYEGQIYRIYGGFKTMMVSPALRKQIPYLKIEDYPRLSLYINGLNEMLRMKASQDISLILNAMIHEFVKNNDEELRNQLAKLFIDTALRVIIENKESLVALPSLKHYEHNLIELFKNSYSAFYELREKQFIARIMEVYAMGGDKDLVVPVGANHVSDMKVNLDLQGFKPIVLNNFVEAFADDENLAKLADPKSEHYDDFLARRAAAAGCAFYLEHATQLFSR